MTLKLHSITEPQITGAIPIPAQSPKKSRLPFAKLSVGESFFTPGNYKSEMRRVGVKSATHFFRIIPTIEQGLIGARIWRVL